jgi:phosphoglycerol transferase
MKFPDEVEFARLQDYDGARGYLHSDDLRWSWGAMKGRPRDWQAETVNFPPTVLVPMVSAAGFDGIYLDRFGYADNGGAIEAQLGLILGVQPFVSADGRLAFFDLRPYNRRLRLERSRAEIDALADVTIHPLRTAWSTDSFNKESRDGLHLSRWTSHERAWIDVTNPSDGPRVALLSVRLSRPGAAPADVDLRYPDGQTQRVRVTSGGPLVERRLRVPAGESAIEIETAAVPLAQAAGANSPGFVQLTDFQLIPLEARDLSGAQ